MLSGLLQCREKLKVLLGPFKGHDVALIDRKIHGNANKTLLSWRSRPSDDRRLTKHLVLMNNCFPVTHSTISVKALPTEILPKYGLDTVVDCRLLHMRYQFWTAIFFAIAATITPAIGPVNAELPPLIPRDVLLGNPERSHPEISPDGKYLAYLAPDTKNVLQVWVRTIGQQDDRILTADKERGIRNYYWTYDGEHLIYEQDTKGDENWRFYLASTKSGKVRDLTPSQGVQARMVGFNPKFPNQALVAMNLKSVFKHDVYRIDLNTGEAKLDAENPGNAVDARVDEDFQVRAASVIREDGGTDLMVRDAIDKPWRVLRQWEPNSGGGPVSFSKDGSTLNIIDNQNSDTTQLVAVNLQTKQKTLLAFDPKYDISDTLIHPVTKKILAVGVQKAKLEWKAIDPSVAADLAAMSKVRDGELSFSSCDLAFKTCVVSYSSDLGPTYYYLYDRTSKKSTLLFSSQSRLEKLPLAPMQPISYQSRDGLTIHGYLTKPKGIPGKNLPTVLFVHGGPWGRDEWGFDGAAQWLANRGYAVLQVNYRGSTGYGKKFLNAGNREWGGKMHTDLIDGVNWLKQQGISDPKRIAIFGGSYGGYATLAGLAFTPDVFAAGVDMVGPSNLSTLIQSIPPYWFSGRPAFIYRVGDPDKDAEFLKTRSPLFAADKIQRPLLIGQGANDPRVKQAESDQIVAAMRKTNKPVEYILYPDEGHGFARPANRLHFFASAEAFLAKHLGGRFEPMGNIAGHSGQTK
jgi:dipeptidyl aminopeptidase/acylaminoacyl peptidase